MNEPPPPPQRPFCIMQYNDSHSSDNDSQQFLDKDTSNPPESDTNIVMMVDNNPNDPHVPGRSSPKKTTVTPPPKKKTSSSSSSANHLVKEMIENAKLLTMPASRRRNRHQFCSKIVVGSHVKKRIGNLLDNDRTPTGKRRRAHVLGTVVKATSGKKNSWIVHFDNGVITTLTSSQLGFVHNDHVHQNILKTKVSNIMILLL